MMVFFSIGTSHASNASKKLEMNFFPKHSEQLQIRKINIEKHTHTTSTLF